MTRTASWLLRVALLAGSTAVSLVLAEAALRLLLPPFRGVANITDDAELGWDSVPSVVSLENTGGRASVYFLGDSFTQDRRWPKLTQHEAAALGLPFDGFVLGVTGFGTTQALLKLQREFEHRRPAVVLLLFYAWNDLRDNVAAPAIFYSPTTRTRPYLIARDTVTLRPAAPLSIWGRLLYQTDVSRRFALKVLLRAGDVAARTDLDALARWHVPVSINYTEPASWEPFYLPGPDGPYVQEAYTVTTEAFRRMRDFLSSRGAQLGVIGIDNPFVADADVADAWIRPGLPFDPDRPLRRIGEILAAHGIPFVSATPALREARARLGKKIYNPPAGALSGHLEPEGEAVVARLAAAMAARLLVEGRALPDPGRHATIP